MEQSAQSINPAIAILHELRHALQNLLATGQETVLDLRTLPLGPADLGYLHSVLGKGEVEANLNALGNSVIRETRFAGVWLIEHFDTEGQPSGSFIEVTYVPSLLQSQRPDIQSGLQALTELTEKAEYPTAR